MSQPYPFLRASVKIFRVLAWVALGIPVVTGVILIVVGGEPVLWGGIDLPARVVGLLNVVAGGLYFFSMWLVSDLLQLLLDIREHVQK